jgi:prolyl-tRNA editing enzyme YbaK/EbsC (Cys-tRNA(Pro) deacylase)
MTHKGAIRMSIEKAREHFQKLGIAQRILEFPVSSATVALAAEALGVEPGRIAKTLSFRQGEGCMLVLAAGDRKIDNAKFKARFGMKAAMLSPEEARDRVGHEIGGVCPFGIPEGIPVYLDMSLQRFPTVFPACGSSNSAIELTCDELFACAGALEWVDVSKA